MIYLWHNAQLRSYELGNIKEFELAELISGATLVHEFTSEEARFADRILINMNRAAGVGAAVNV
ncbi:MAG: hypothetical protein RJQ14_07165 [Marinoscillum sp.]